jgi:tetratricopeptide (TPR) repeat protein
MASAQDPGSQHGTAQIPERFLHHQESQRFWAQYGRTKQLSDLSESISYLRKALALENDLCPRSQLLGTLAGRLATRFRQTFNLGDCASAKADLKEAKLRCREALAITPVNTINRKNILTNFNIILHIQYVAEILEDEDGSVVPLLDKMIKVQEELAQYNPERQFPTLSLLEEYLARFEKTGVIVEGLGAVLAIARDSEVLLSQLLLDIATPERRRIFCHLSYTLRRRCETMNALGDHRDIERAIELARDAVNGGPIEDPYYPDFQANLGSTLVTRYKRSGDIEDLEEGIRLVQEARMANIQKGDTGAEMINLNDLAFSLVMRYERTAELSDLDLALEWGQQSVNGCTEDMVTKSRRLNNLSIGWGRRYERTTELRDLENAIERSMQSVNLCPPGDIFRPIHLNSLGIWLGWRFERTNDMTDLDEAIVWTTQAVDEINQDHPARNEFLSNLGSFLGTKYKLSKNIAFLDKAIERGEESLRVTPAESPLRIRNLRNLAMNLEEKFEHCNETEYHDRSIHLFKQAISLKSSPPAYRLNVVLDAVGILKKHNDWATACELASTGVKLLPFTSTRFAKTSDQQDSLMRYFGLASDAAGFVLQTGGSPSDAAALLELGRGVIATHQYHARSDLTELKAKHPEEAKQFEILRDSTVASTDDKSNNSPLSSSLRHTSSLQLDELIQKIQNLPGFDRFLLPPNTDELMQTAELASQPIVIINVSFRCDALIISTGGSKGITSVHLPELNREMIEKKIKDFNRANIGGRLEVLEWMWNIMVRPIIKEVGLLDGIGKPRDLHDMPRICWIPTGPLCQLPIHAAGIHEDQLGHTVLDCAISSYSVSAKALMYTRECEASIVWKQFSTINFNGKNTRWIQVATLCKERD